MNFVLDNYIEQLDMAQKGWTQKLALRVEKALTDGSEEIELFLLRHFQRYERRRFL